MRGLCVPWRILIVDDHPVLRRMVRSLLETIPEFDVCGEAENGQQGIEKARQLSPDAIILDISMPVLNGLEAAKILRTMLPSIKILMFTSFAHAGLSQTATAAGASRVVCKSSPPAALIKALQELLMLAA
jgi:two-component system, NarL family, nitrate/nitrite response regulator NarL